MLIIDHIAAGVLFSNANRTFQNYAILSVCLIASILPDVLVLFGIPGSILYLDHRKFTNTIILTPIFSLLPAILVYIFVRKKILFLKLYHVSLISYCLHIILDLITPFGTPILYPILGKPYSLDIFHAFDAIYLSISILVLLTFIQNKFVKKKYFPKRTLFIFISIYIIYFIITISLKYNNEIDYKHYSDRNLVDCEYLSTVPRTFWRWKGIVKTKNRMYVLIKEEGEIVMKGYQSIMPPISVQNDYWFIKFLEYARYPITLREKNTVKVINLIYSPDSYALEYDLDSEDRIKDASISGFNIHDNIY